jgi:hypothetical protein
MSHEPPLLLNLPSSEQLELFRALSSILQRNPDELRTTEKEAFRDLILGLSPGVAECWETHWVEKAFPPEAARLLRLSLGARSGSAKR